MRGTAVYCTCKVKVPDGAVVAPVPFAVTVTVYLPAGVPEVCVVELPDESGEPPPQAVIIPTPASSTNNTSRCSVREEFFFLRPAPAASKPGSQKAPASIGMELPAPRWMGAYGISAAVALLVVTTFRVPVCGLVSFAAVKVNDDGLKTQLDALGKPLQASDTVPTKLLVGVTVNVT